MTISCHSICTATTATATATATASTTTANDSGTKTNADGHAKDTTRTYAIVIS